MRSSYLYAWVLCGLTAGGVAVAQHNDMINQPSVGTPLHGRHAWIVLGGPDRMHGPDSTDALKGFDRALALQATNEQVTAYASMVKSAETAIDEMEVFLEQVQKQTSTPKFSGSVHALDEALEKARSENKQFLASFTKPQ